MNYLSVAVALVCVAHSSIAQVILEPNSPTYLCPSEQITLNCSVPDTHNQLVWTASDVAQSNTPLNIIIFCNTMHPSRRGPYQPALIGCADDRINSSLVFNVSHDVNVTCGTGRNDTLMEHVTVGPLGVPPSPVLSLSATFTNATRDNHTAVIQWELPIENTHRGAMLSRILLQFSPPVPECGHNCSLARDTGPLTAGQVSVTLEVGTRYEVVARAESCGGDLSSPWSDTLIIQLQVPSPTMMCVAVPTYDSAADMEMLELNVAWSPLMNSTEITPGVAFPLSGYTVNYTTDSQSIEQTVSPSSCDSQCRDTLSGDEVTSVITTVTVRAWNTFGRGEETVCNKSPISNINDVATVVVEVTDSTAEVSLQWLHQQPVYPHLIRVFCSANLTHKEMDLCGETSGEQEKAVIKELNPNVTYYYKLEAFGEQPFVVQGYFTTVPAASADDTGKARSSRSTSEVVGIVIGASAVGGIPLVAVVGAAVYLLWKRGGCERRTKNTPQYWSAQVEQLVPVLKFSCTGHQLQKPRGIVVSMAGEIFISNLSNETTVTPRYATVSKDDSTTSSAKGDETDSAEHSIQVFSEVGKWLREFFCNLKVPRGLDIDENYLYVSDCVHQYIAKVPLSNHRSLSLCTSQDNGLNLRYPYGLAVVKEINTVFICDEGNCRVVATDLQFNLKYTLGGQGVLAGPVDVAYSYNSGHLYVADFRRGKQIVVFQVGEEKCDAKPVDEFSTTRNEEQTFRRVQGIYIANDRIYITDIQQHIVVVMDLERNLVATIGGEELYNPIAVTVHNVNIYVTSDAKDERKAAVHVYELQPKQQDTCMSSNL